MPPLPRDIKQPESGKKSGSLAQLVEQLTFNQLVAGSNPARPTNVKKRPKGAFLLSAIYKIRICRRFGVERSETTEPFTATARRASEASHPAQTSYRQSRHQFFQRWRGLLLFIDNIQIRRNTFF